VEDPLLVMDTTDFASVGFTLLVFLRFKLFLFFLFPLELFSMASSIFRLYSSIANSSFVRTRKFSFGFGYNDEGLILDFFEDLMQGKKLLFPLDSSSKF